ncbi:hypothetical protein A3C21_03790 [Candidatus Kaiserbacteria bacterium RIFCSPHIGHO2_02_FULL_59_21]|uniref:Addiction module toxin RelE n=1 Tax=Candidatus Kaiserbacteria bacterium RIFCSPHIGHO2_02_FULL_59_21 TaxID=1798500 RepID=A0A1F6E1N0_9BACT|nr:MAG: hypothetical protein A2766_01285 [Candidatus Kaiserbacteria bacterium RIFCSPHIGHO2_01_FULL_58_22]OGG67142.1 MAG: hypothetical protein A3C21_03790 [Candidatus Kaiserbacteria bacterium RIFCSPHIGHO2_02_FULL_59_21]OGG79061.1 MAG: hypothetical protein A2952_02885 [Candidatus Kaiserbacteria bacterium RIFCSPLOWO2_01_FULL_59_34]OGG86332.1 MAG: hypothetical protein A3I47_01150 [Candidatus Kaiserbacteria bacterium RIFCSPLOWO2_02_FULL_59_19]
MDTPLITLSPVRSFIDELPLETRERVYHSLALLRTFGRQLPPPDSKKVTRELLELRIRGKTQVRILYGFFGNSAVLTSAFKKKSGKIPLREIELAPARLSRIARL